MATQLWMWNGTHFGYREGNDLWTRDGVLAGHVHGNEIYGANGHYLGEIDGDRLRADISKATKHETPFGPRHGAPMSHGSLGSRGMVGGYKEFPAPETFK